MKASHIIAACLASGVQTYRDDWLDSLINSGLNKPPIKPAQSDDEKAYLLNKAEQKRNRKNIKRMVNYE